MTNLTPEMEHVVATLRARLNKKSDVDDSPLWNGSTQSTTGIVARISQFPQS